MSTTNISDYNELFLKTALDHINEIESLLQKYLEDPQAPELPKEVFRHAHSLKGSANVMGHSQIVELCDQIDNLIRTESDIYRLTSESVTQIQQKVEEIKEVMHSIMHS